MNRTLICGLLAALALTIGCDDGDGGGTTGAGGAGADAGADGGRALQADGTLRLSVELPADPTPGLEGAAADLLDAARRITGATGDGDGGLVVRVTLDLADAAAGTYAIAETDDGLGIAAPDALGAQNGLYRVVHDLGVRYYHPGDSWYPSDAGAALPGGYDGTVDTPRFAYRGFHEHSQHPVPMSDVYMRPDGDGFRALASEYLRWLARNRQNVASFHFLKTVDQEAWLPWIRDIVDEAHGYGIKFGMVTGFSDQQQNAFTLVREDTDASEAEQIAAGLDRLVGETGYDFLGLQIGASEFFKVPDDTTIERIDTAVAHVRDNHPDARLFAWIHIACDLEADDGSYFYHLPLRTDPGMGAWVHTTMYYTLDDPAPVYECEDFSHQLDFVEASVASGDGRPLWFFPETAWWLGFDNNLPLAMPITGWSRGKDIQQLLADAPVEGHVTFTTGREWGYWRYDHYLTRVTWDGEVTWEDYLDEIEPMFGPAGEALVGALKAWTELQVQHFYEDNPDIYFYVAGELPQDELGEAAGILARPPKPAFRRVMALDDDAFAAWEMRDYEMLLAMREAYGAVFDPLPSTFEGTDQEIALAEEVHRTLGLYVDRLDHAIALYGGVRAIRRWEVERGSDAPDESIREMALMEAETLLAEAKAISASTIAEVAAQEAHYRWPIELLAEEKPESLTSYPYGYLWETRTGYFWTRRDDQLEGLIGEVFDTAPQEWSEAPTDVLRLPKTGVTVTEPQNPVVGSLLANFMPDYLLAHSGVDGDTTDVGFAQDFDQNGMPDAGTESRLTLTRGDEGWAGTTDAIPVRVRDSSGATLGELPLLDPQLTLSAALDEVTVAGGASTRGLIDLISSIGGIDEEGVTNLVRQVFGIPADAPLPDRLALTFAFAVESGE
jgi:hypothetical protein